MIVFLGLEITDSLPVEHRIQAQASLFGDVIHTMMSSLFILYQGSWISFSVSNYYKLFQTLI